MRTVRSLLFAGAILGALAPSVSHARYYAPMEAVWLSPDPLGQAAGPNYYLYANAQPTMVTDPTGLIVATNDSRIQHALNVLAATADGAGLINAAQSASILFTLQLANLPFGPTVVGVTGADQSEPQDPFEHYAKCGQYEIVIRLDFDKQRALLTEGDEFGASSVRAAGHELTHAVQYAQSIGDIIIGSPVPYRGSFPASLFGFLPVSMVLDVMYPETHVPIFGTSSQLDSRIYDELEKGRLPTGPF